MTYLFFGFLIIALIDLPPLIKKKRKRELIVFCCFFVAVGALAILQVADIKIPSPLTVVGDFMKQVIHLSY